MRLLVVEGNPKEIWEKRERCGGIPYHKRFHSLLKLLVPHATIDFAFPADRTTSLPSGKKLARYDGVMWTGSSLHVNNPSSPVSRQLSFAEDVFKCGIPCYGSCWGLQIAVTVLGGEVNTCPKGRELGISGPIELTDAGHAHPCFQGRQNTFQALSIHLDEVVRLPENARVLATNDHSSVQALGIKHGQVDFFGVQYHPEFTIGDMAFMIRYGAEDLIQEGFFTSEKDLEAFVANLEHTDNLPESISNTSLQINEVKQWLNVAVKPE